jgi:spoIIIJ-associated protein
MIKIESVNLQEAYEKAALHFSCSVTELHVEVIQHPSSGFFGFFKKNAIIVASCKKISSFSEPIIEKKISELIPEVSKFEKPTFQEIQEEKIKTPFQKQKILNDTILPVSFVQDQEEHEDELKTQQYDESYSNDLEKNYFQDDIEVFNIHEVAQIVKEEINHLFEQICFEIDVIDVKVYDDSTLLVEITGEDSALLIGKEGYRYKALSYMIFNWINSKYQLQLRLEIAEFLKNQEESISRYLVGVCETIEREGRAQTKILDGVLVQIALKQLRETYPDKYVAIRSTRDGLKFIIINDYNGY